MRTGDVIGFIDADNKTPIAEFDKVEPLLSDGCDVVIGSRGLRASRIERAQPLYRRLGSRGFGLFMHACVGLNDIPDTQCGFKFFRGDVARDLFRLQQIDGYMFDVEILYLARQLGYRIAAGAGALARRWRQPAAAGGGQHSQCPGHRLDSMAPSHRRLRRSRRSRCTPEQSFLRTSAKVPE